jgi:hypothetical protein
MHLPRRPGRCRSATELGLSVPVAAWVPRWSDSCVREQADSADSLGAAVGAAFCLHELPEQGKVIHHPVSTGDRQDQLRCFRPRPRFQYLLARLVRQRMNAEPPSTQNWTRCHMGLNEVTRTVFRAAWNLPPNKLGRFLISTVIPGEYAQGVRRLHEEAQRTYDQNTLHVLASVALWARRQEGRTLREEALSVLKAFSQQSGAELDDALNPHAAAVANLLLDRDERRRA